MVEVKEGLLLGNEDDAAVMASGGRHHKKRTVSHILSIMNEPPDWSDVAPTDSDHENGPRDGDDGSKDGVNSPKDGVNSPKEGDDGSKGEEGEGGSEEGGGSKPSRVVTKFVQAADHPETDLLHHFESCCQFIKQGVGLGGVLVHW